MNIARESVEEVPVGAVLVREGVVIASSSNRMFRDSDPTAHAEMLVIRKAVRKLGVKFLQDSELYVTLEPCPMCMYAISLSRVGVLCFAASDEKRGAISRGCLDRGTYFHVPVVYEGIMEEEARLLLSSFFQVLRDRECGKAP